MTEATKPQFLFLFDENRRIYPLERRGDSSPIWRKHWKKHDIIGETARSWLLNYGVKVLKRKTVADGVAYTEEELDEASYVHDNSYRISERVRTLKDFKKLYQIASIINYEA